MADAAAAAATAANLRVAVGADERAGTLFASRRIAWRSGRTGAALSLSLSAHRHRRHLP
jgi:hypothetical protein